MSGGLILVAGSLHYDIVVNAPHLPTADETVMGGPMQFVCGGKGGNQAVAASLHGAPTTFGGMVGTDGFGDALIDHLRAAGVDTSHIGRTGNAATGASVAIVEEDGNYGAVVASGANLLIDPDQIGFPEGTDWLILQNEIPETANVSLARRARRCGARVVLNAAPWRHIRRDLFEAIDLLVVNRIEASGLFGAPVTSVGDAKRLLEDRNFPMESLVVTLGGEGLVFSSRGSAPQHVAAFDVDVISTHGAGDVFVGTMCAEFCRGSALRDSLAYASAAAALHVSTPVIERQSLGRDQTANFMASARRRA